MGTRLEDVGFVVVDGNLYAAITAGTYQDFGPAADIYDVSALLSPEKGVGNVISNFSDPKAEGRETINGVKTVRVTGTISAEAVNAIAPQLAVTGPVPGTAWITEEGNHELMQVKIDPAEGQGITMTMSDWGKPVTVNKPTV
jgi:lipoprotein LprG